MNPGLYLAKTSRRSCRLYFSPAVGFFPATSMQITSGTSWRFTKTTSGLSPLRNVVQLGSRYLLLVGKSCDRNSMCPFTKYRWTNWLNIFFLNNTVKLGYSELGYNEHSVITKRFLSQIGHFSTQINPVITNPGYNEQKCLVPSCWL